MSSYQNEQYEKKYGVRLSVGQQVTVLGLTEGGGVNAYPTKVRGIFEPLYYKNVFNYINFMDMGTYSGRVQLHGGRPRFASREPREGACRGAESEEAIFALAEDPVGGDRHLDAEVRDPLRLHDDRGAAEGPRRPRCRRERLAAQGFEVKAARWDEASGFFARIASGAAGLHLPCHRR